MLGRVLLVAGVVAVLVLAWGWIEGLEARLALRERQLANHQAVLEAISATGKITASDLRPLLGDEPPTEYEGGYGWAVDLPDRTLDSTDHPDVSLEFSEDGRLTGVYAYKP